MLACPTARMNRYSNLYWHRAGHNHSHPQPHAKPGRSHPSKSTKLSTARRACPVMLCTRKLEFVLCGRRGAYSSRGVTAPARYPMRHNPGGTLYRQWHSNTRASSLKGRPIRPLRHSHTLNDLSRLHGMAICTVRRSHQASDKA